MGLLDGIFGSRSGKGPATGYVRTLMREPEPADVEWLCDVATGDDRDRAVWELRYLKRALGLVVAQRDALDDRTASSVAHELAEQMAADRNVAAPMLRLAERQFNERLSAYREMMALRGAGEPAAERIGRTLLLMSGAGRVGKDDLAAAAVIADRYLSQAVDGLRTAFGHASSPGTSGRGPAS